MSLAITHRTCSKLARQHIDSLNTHTVQTYGFLKGFTFILTARIHLTYGSRQRLQGNTSTIVAHRHDIILDGDFDTVTRTHNKLVNRVIHSLLNQYIDTIIGLRAITQLADIHTRTQTQMFARRKCLYRIIVVRYGGWGIFYIVCHIYLLLVVWLIFHL